MPNISTRSLRLAGYAVFLALAGTAGAQAQQMGKGAWDFTPRASSMSAQFDFQQRMTETAAGMGALHQYVTNYNSSSTSVGNLNEINQILSEGASGYLDTNSNQDSNGNQGSDADTDVTVDNSLTKNVVKRREPGTPPRPAVR